MAALTGKGIRYMVLLLLLILGGCDRTEREWDAVREEPGGVNVRQSRGSGHYDCCGLFPHFGDRWERAVHMRMPVHLVCQDCGQGRILTVDFSRQIGRAHV